MEVEDGAFPLCVSPEVHSEFSNLKNGLTQQSKRVTISISLSLLPSLLSPPLASADEAFRDVDIAILLSGKEHCCFKELVLNPFARCAAHRRLSFSRSSLGCLSHPSGSLCGPRSQIK